MMPCSAALTLAIDRWAAPSFKIAIAYGRRCRLFRRPWAATKEELEQVAGHWPDIEEIRATEAKRLLKGGGAEGVEPSSSSTAMSTSPRSISGTWVLDDGARSAQVTQRVLPTAVVQSMRAQG